jgi:hypothetical protein
MKKKWLLLITAELALVLVTALAGCTLTSTQNTTPTSTNQQPIDVVSVSGPLPPINPGGPIVEITLKNISSEPVISLTATIELGRSFNFNFDVNSSNPLLPSKNISSRLTLIGGGFSDNISYPLMISGISEDGVAFAYTRQVQIVAPAPTSANSSQPMLPDRSNVYSFQLNLVPDKPIYLPGEPVQMELILTNASTGDATSPITVSQVPPAIDLVTSGYDQTTSGERLDTPKVIKSFPAGNAEITLGLGQKVTYQLRWDQRDNNGKQASPGWYFYSDMLNLKIAGQNEWSGSVDRAFLIQYPQGAIQKTIDLNQSQTISGFSFDDTISGKRQTVDLALTLKHVELNEKTLSFLVVATSPNNPLSGYEGWGDVTGQAQYAIDGVVNNTTWYPTTTQSLDSGIEMRWGYDDGYLEPVPNGSKQLTVIITNIGDWQGYLEYQVPLD